MEFDSALANLPICYDYCDSWFLACAEDLTCAKNWITDWIYIDGINVCKPDAQCSTYRYNFDDKVWYSQSHIIHVLFCTEMFTMMVEAYALSCGVNRFCTPILNQMIPTVCVCFLVGL